MVTLNEWLIMAFYIALILITPGPTNTLLLSAGLQRGLNKSFHFIFAEAIGYILAISIWGFFLLSLEKIFPYIYQIAKLLSSIYVLWLASKLWMLSLKMDYLTSKSSSLVKTFSGKHTNFVDITIATLLNPKAILFVSTIIPISAFNSINIFLSSIVIFLTILIPIGVLWIFLGNIVHSNKYLRKYIGVFLRIASTILILFSFLLVYSGIAKAENSLTLYNWQSYTSPELLKKFKQEYNIDILLLEYKSNEEALDGVKNGKIDADIVVVSDNFLPHWITAGLLKPINVNSLSNSKNITASWQKPSSDIKRNYGIPWSWGIVGIAVHTDTFNGDANTWKIILEPPKELSGTINVGSDMNELIYAAIRYHGGKICDSHPELLEKVRNTLLKAKKHWAAMDYGSVYMMASGKFKASIDWNGAAMRQRKINPHIQFSFPREGTLIFRDNLVILKKSKNYESAKLFLNFIMQPENAALNSAFHGYDSAIEGANTYLPSWMQNAPELNIPEQVLRNSDYSINCPFFAREKYTDIWQQLLEK
ncbi:extracellular solute-binding protein [Xenorhabdus miraniensis]|uniref:Spermidine/putrescine ABC transporter substrate-binding protein n=1 Tax=Xenorhabdus miraniensis TaxID=351674 RepID=A0A2D0JUX4_9GAMM|nr:extracellular solute-binding protein [Xenorhabdus miraniensis]PHM50116.1 spermidine/putrescine ABC transporter substrate-binding protein [Xenorhabdus miraniensis]